MGLVLSPQGHLEIWEGSFLGGHSDWVATGIEWTTAQGCSHDKELSASHTTLSVLLDSYVGEKSVFSHLSLEA